MYEYLIDRLRCIADKGRLLSVQCSKRTLKDAAIALENQQNHIKALQIISENNRRNMERAMEELHKVESDLERAAARIAEWEKYRQLLLFEGRIPPEKWNGSEGK